jgi:hypothetical protein
MMIYKIRVSLRDEDRKKKAGIIRRSARLKEAP